MSAVLRSRESYEALVAEYIDLERESSDALLSQEYAEGDAHRRAVRDGRPDAAKRRARQSDIMRELIDRTPGAEHCDLEQRWHQMMDALLDRINKSPRQISLYAGRAADGISDLSANESARTCEYLSRLLSAYKDLRGIESGARINANQPARDQADALLSRLMRGLPRTGEAIRWFGTHVGTPDEWHNLGRNYIIKRVIRPRRTK